MRATALTVTVLIVCGYATYATAGDKSLASGAAAVGGWEKTGATLQSVAPAQIPDDQLLKPADVNINIQVGTRALSVVAPADGQLGRMQSLANSAGRVALGDVTDAAARLELRPHPGDYSVRSDTRSHLLPTP